MMNKWNRVSWAMHGRVVFAALALCLVASHALGDGLESMGNTDGVLTWRLGVLEPGEAAQETVLFAYAPSPDDLSLLLEQARSAHESPVASSGGAAGKKQGDPVWIRNGKTNLAFLGDGSFFWEGTGQALVCERGGQLSRFSFFVHYNDGAPRRAGISITRRGSLENLKVVEGMRALDEARATGLLETGDRKIRIRITGAMGEGPVAAVTFQLLNTGSEALKDLRLSAYANLEAAHDHENDFSVLDPGMAGLLVLDPPTGMCVAMAGVGRPALGHSGLWASENVLRTGTGIPIEEWPLFPGMSEKLGERLARASIPHPPAPLVEADTPPTETLTRAAAEEVLRRDWLFQAEGRPLHLRAREEIGWAWELAARLCKAGVAGRSPDLRSEEEELRALDARLHGLKPTDMEGETAEEIYLAVRRVKRRIAFKNPVVDFSKVLFIDNPFPQGSEWPHEARHRNGMMAVPGGRLLVLDGLHPGGSIQRLAPDRPGSFWRPDLSFDGKKVLFCFKPHDERAFHLFEINVDGTGLRQLTFGDYDDLDPAYMPDGHILFSTTRCNTYIRCMPYTYSYVLARCNGDGGEIYLISRGNEPDWLPTLLSDGRVIYTRWEYTDKALWRIQSLWTVNQDGTHPAAFWGNQSVWPDMLIEPRQIPGSRRVMFTGAAHHNWFAGSIGILDPREGFNFPDGLTKVTADVPWPECGPPPEDPVESLRYHTSGPYTAYKTPFPLSEEDFLVSAQGNGKFRLYLMDVHGNRELIFEGAHHIWHALPLEAREPPPVHPDSVAWPGAGADRKEAEPGVLYSADIYQGVPDLPRGMVKYLRVIQMDYRTYSTWTRDARFQGPGVSLIQDDGVKRILGTVPVEPDGSVHFKVPPGKTLHFQVLDESFRALQTMRSFTGAMPGERRGCVGCHEMHSVTPPNKKGTALRLGPRDLDPPPWGTESISFERLVQPVLEKNCGRCHTGDGEGRKKLDLTLRPGFLFFKEPYVTLVGPAQFSGMEPVERPGIAGAIMAENFGQSDPASYVTFRPMKHLSFASRLIEIAMSGEHNDVKVDPTDLRKLIAWVDANCPFRGDRDIRAIADPEFPGIELLPIRPRCRTAPEVIRF